MLSRLRSPPLSVFLTAASHYRVAPFAQTELDQFSFQATRPVASRQMGRANRGCELQIFADGQVFIERVLLRNVTDVTLELIEIRIKLLVIEQDLTAGRLQLSGQAP